MEGDIELRDGSRMRIMWDVQDHGCAIIWWEPDDPESEMSGVLNTENLIAIRDRIDQVLGR